MKRCKLNRRALYGAVILIFSLWLAFNPSQSESDIRSAGAAASTTPVVSINPVHIFVKFDGIDGPFTDPEHLKWIDAMSYSSGIASNGCNTSDKGFTSSFSTVKITKPTPDGFMIAYAQDADGDGYRHYSADVPDVIK